MISPASLGTTSNFSSNIFGANAARPPMINVSAHAAKVIITKHGIFI